MKRVGSSSVLRYGLASVFTRGIAIVSTLALTPLIINKLGVTEYGIWFMATLVPTLIAFPDFGISNGIINKVSDLKRRTGSIARLIPNLLELEVLLRTVSLLWLVLGSAALFMYVQSYNEVAQRGVLLETLLLSLAIFCLGIPPALWARVQLGLERGHESITWEGVGKAGALGCALLVLLHHPEIRLLTIATLLPPVLASYANAFLFRRSNLQEAKSRDRSRGIRTILTANMETLRTGGYFTLIQVAFVLGFALDPFLIGQFSTVDTVSYVSVIRRPFDALPLVITLFSTALWPVFNRLQAEHQFLRIRRLIIVLILSSTTLILTASSVLVVFKDGVYNFLGQNSFEIAQQDLMWVAVKTWSITMVIILNNYMSAVGLVKQQALIQFASAAVSLIVVIYFLRTDGISSYLVATAIIYLLLTLVPMSIVSLNNINMKIRSKY
ncbi:lipopolysaccharide biosynthesis protein [Deinococcus sp. RL]|uniref:lipopolysaccharide biosynthesis protein n=1 Tax=Deinococcus sp. RL TaxID=1489678 RepID=UPI001267EF03|nr:hypothetical protein [Deinococcus sp. RL]